MSGLVLLVIGLVGLGLVIAAFAYVGYAFYRLVKAGLHVARTYGPRTAELAAKAAAAQELVARAGKDTQEISASLASLQISLRRLQIAFEALQQALVPYQKLRAYFGR
jgi:hypothetical protein